MVTFSQPPQFKLDPRLARLLGLHTQSRSAIVQALWQYVKTNRLQDSHDKEYINGDKYFQQVPSPPSPGPWGAGRVTGRGSAPTKVTPPTPFSTPSETVSEPETRVLVQALPWHSSVRWPAHRSHPR